MQAPRWDPSRPAIEGIYKPHTRERHIPEERKRSPICKQFKMTGKNCGDKKCEKRHSFLDAEEESRAMLAREKRAAAKAEQAMGEEPHDKVQP